jgi:hypothetical protein
MRTIMSGLILAAVVTGCAAAGPRSEPGEDEEEEGEFEVVGGLPRDLAADQFVVMVSARPCDLAGVAEMMPLGGYDTVAGTSRERLYGLEAILGEDGIGYLCGFALDAGRRVVGFGSYPGNPLTEEVAADETVPLYADLPLAAVDPPIPLDRPRLAF